jgi:hypothetical protein
MCCPAREVNARTPCTCSIFARADRPTALRAKDASVVADDVQAAGSMAAGRILTRIASEGKAIAGAAFAKTGAPHVAAGGWGFGCLYHDRHDALLKIEDTQPEGTARP